MKDNGKDNFLPKCLRAGVCMLTLIILIITANKTEDKKSDDDSRRMQVEKTGNGSYENDTYQCINETERELVKTFYEEATEDGVSVRIVRFSDGEEQVLMDCRYSEAAVMEERCAI